MIRGVKAGKIYRVENKDKHGAANNHYNLVIIECNDGSIDELLLTDSEVLKGIERTKRNREDIPKYTLDSDCCAYWYGLIFVSAVSSALGYFIRDLNLF